LLYNVISLVATQVFVSEFGNSASTYPEGLKVPSSDLSSCQLLIAVRREAGALETVFMLCLSIYGYLTTLSRRIFGPKRGEVRGEWRKT